MKKLEPDQLYAAPLDEIVSFRFDETVVDVFPDMINRSVPGYSTLINMAGILSSQYAQRGSQLYDLGCSLGAVTLSMRRRLTQPDCRLFAIDNSAAMLSRCRQYVGADTVDVPVEFACADIQNVAIERASVVVLNLTLQFIAPSHRMAMIEKIYAGMLPGGVLLLSEKLAFHDAAEAVFFTEMHHAFKRSNGYSELEVSQKRAALDNVLVPDTREQHEARLRGAGFHAVRQWFQCLNFVSFMAVK
ncbi:MAG: carboxy-S-adenosyl-L-methionine synthase CmoA [Thiotrichaceae bacterium]|nr:carboxy-S-adenosyl-L-methionine synthase CmoA [Thiotrichaceae bacterium]PCI13709.1 MAG: carboxy-S-adenosyl-L-methionine synthase CmoA [Thiotrichales bacterium]